MWHVERRHEVVGLVVSDLLRWDEDGLVDESLEWTAVEGVAIAARLCRPDIFSMTSGIEVRDGGLPRRLAHGAKGTAAGK